MSSDPAEGASGGIADSGSMASAPTAGDRTRSLRRVRQIREFTSAPLTDGEVDAMVDAARWSGSSRNVQPWRFIVLREVETLRRLAEIGMPQTIPLSTAVAAIALVVPADPADAIWVAYDEGRATERILIAASELGLGAGITWIRRDIQPRVAELLGLPGDRIVRTIVAIGHPSEAAQRPKSPPGTARLPRTEVVFVERWPAEGG
jgi:nitroreductase